MVKDFDEHIILSRDWYDPLAYHETPEADSDYEIIEDKFGVRNPGVEDDEDLFGGKDRDLGDEVTGTAGTDEE